MAAPPQHAPEQPAPRRRTCDGCGRPPAVCLCSSLPVPRLQPATRVIILQHPKEARRKVVKTADLIASCLASGRCELLTGKDFGSELKSWADSRRPDDRWLLLWPGADARPIDTLAPSELGPEPEPEPEPAPAPAPAPALAPTVQVYRLAWRRLLATAAATDRRGGGCRPSSSARCRSPCPSAARSGRSPGTRRSDPQF